MFLLMTPLFMMSCAQIETHEPTPEDFQVGEKWVWHWSRTVDGEIRAEGDDLQEVVIYNGVRSFWNGMDTTEISKIVNQPDDDTPFRDWPLYIGKTWTFESEWENDEGTSGKTSQEVEVVAFEEVEVAAGKFMAYKIEQKGTVTNSRGFNGEMTDIWWYAPDLKFYVKHVNSDGYGMYVNELTEYFEGT